MACGDLDLVARPRHDTLDEVHVRLLRRGLDAHLALRRRTASALVPLLGAGRRMEDHDVADLRVPEAGADAVDEHALADLERRDHRLTRDAVRLDQERLDPERQAERDGDDQYQLEQRTRR